MSWAMSKERKAQQEMGETRRRKSEYRNPKQIQMIKKLLCSKREGSDSEVLEFFRFWIYLAVSLFRISSFEFWVLIRDCLAPWRDNPC